MAKKKVGRPSNYKKEYCDIIEAELSKGYSIRASCSSIGVVHDTVYRWMKKYPEFSDAIKRGVNAGLKQLETVCLGAIYGKKPINKDAVTLSIFFLKTRFHEVYGDKTLSIDDGNVEINLKINKDAPPE